ncbi:MAG TPA: hypothetical protein VNN73_22180 [Blastocatellia bacterium]|nr:hypothetical protein [Blastocatellia bacterium]
MLTNTGGSFTITGSGTADSGGVIQNTTGSGILADNAQNLSLSWIKINNTGAHGIDAQNLKGTCLLANSTIMDWTSVSGNGVNFVNNNSNLTLLTINATTGSTSAT